MSEPVTAETLTDEEIREFRNSIPNDPEFGGFDWQRGRECEWALVKPGWDSEVADRVKLAKKRVAALFNARREGSK